MISFCCISFCWVASALPPLPQFNHLIYHHWSQKGKNCILTNNSVVDVLKSCAAVLLIWYFCLWFYVTFIFQSFCVSVGLDFSSHLCVLHIKGPKSNLFNDHLIPNALINSKQYLLGWKWEWPTLSFFFCEQFCSDNKACLSKETSELLALQTHKKKFCWLEKIGLV